MNNLGGAGPLEGISWYLAASWYSTQTLENGRRGSYPRQAELRRRCCGAKRYAFVILGEEHSRSRSLRRANRQSLFSANSCEHEERGVWRSIITASSLHTHRETLIRIAAYHGFRSLPVFDTVMAERHLPHAGRILCGCAVAEASTQIAERAM